MKKSVTTCAQCSDFSCSLVDEVFRIAPQAKKTLEALRKK